ncbi:MAG: hypothetical protein C0615_06335, partial [Desulfuromonas sp.]
MNKLVLALVGLAMLATPAFAAIEVEGDAYAGVADKYMWRGFNLSASQPVLQMGTDLSAKGFTFSYWTNTQLSGAGNDEITETDVVLDYTFDVAEILSVSVGDIYYNFNVPGNTHELYLGVAADVISAPALTIYYDWDAANDADLDGLFYTLSFGHDIELMEKLGLSLGALVSYNDESPFVGVYSEFHNYELNAGLSYAVTDQISVDAYGIYSDAISDEAELAIGDDGESTGGVTVTLAF